MLGNEALQAMADKMDAITISVVMETECKERMAKGEIQYGVFNPETDQRNLLNDIREEAIDIINYSRMRRLQKPGFDHIIENLAKEIYRLTFTVE